MPLRQEISTDSRRASAPPIKTSRGWVERGCAAGAARSALGPRAQRFWLVLPAGLALFSGGSLTAFAATLDLGKLPPPATRAVDFTSDIKPIFAAHCVQCHGADKQRSGLRLDDREAALKGGENHAPAIKPKNSADSPLIHFVAGLVPDMKMPKQGDPLTAGEIGLLRA